MVVDRSAGAFIKLLGDVPSVVWALLFTQAIGFALYQVHQDQRIAALEQSQRSQDTIIAEIRAKIDTIDEKGTRRLVIIEERQTNVLKRLDELEHRTYDLFRLLKNGTLPP